jgi:hypothetical protein
LIVSVPPTTVGLLWLPIALVGGGSSTLVVVVSHGDESRNKKNELENKKSKGMSLFD